MLSCRMLTFKASGTAAAAAALAATTAFAVAPAHADTDDIYMAIAYSPSAGEGWAGDGPTADQAKAAAMAECQQHAGDCQFAVVNKNGCVAVVASDDGWAGGAGPDPSAAKADAASKIGGGHRHVVLYGCTAGAG